MKHTILNRISIGFGAILVAMVAGFTATPAQAAEAQGDQPPCATPELSQLFISYNDTGWYTLLAGETMNSFDGVGWKLGGGARIVTTKLTDGHVGHVLDLPSGSVAASPPICVSSSFTSARAMMRTLSRNDGGVSVYVSSAGWNAWTGPQSIGPMRVTGTDWEATDPLSLEPAIHRGWQRVQFTLVPRGERSEYQLYRFGLDPRMK